MTLITTLPAPRTRVDLATLLCDRHGGQENRWLSLICLHDDVSGVEDFLEGEGVDYDHMILSIRQIAGAPIRYMRHVVPTADLPRIPPEMLENGSPRMHLGPFQLHGFRQVRMEKFNGCPDTPHGKFRPSAHEPTGALMHYRNVQGTRFYRIEIGDAA